jgi:hypothetical protein
VTGAAVVCPAVARCIGVGARWLLVAEEEGAACRCGVVWNMIARRVRVSTDNLGELSHPHPHSSAPSEQQQHSKVSLRRAVDTVQRFGVRSNRPSTGSERRHDRQAACEPGGGGCWGVPDHLARLHTHRTFPAQALLTILMRHAATSHLLSHCPRRVYDVRYALAER